MPPAWSSYRLPPVKAPLCFQYRLKQGELPSVINQISSADSGTLIKSIANNAVASGVLSSGMLDGLEKVVGKKVINDFGGRELLEQALLSGNTEGIKVAASGALATCVNKGLVKALPANTPGIVVSGLAYSPAG